jgi:hypothetical protein
MANEYEVHISGEVHSTHDTREDAHNTIMTLINSGTIAMGQAWLVIPYPGDTPPPSPPA